MNNGQLGLVDQDNREMTLIVIDFISGKTAYRRKYGHAGGEAISKAVGIKKGHRPNIVDATAGWGRDAFVLATLGCRVHMMMGSGLLYCLHQNGYQEPYLEIHRAGKSITDLAFKPPIFHPDASTFSRYSGKIDAGVQRRKGEIPKLNLNMKAFAPV